MSIKDTMPEEILKEMKCKLKRAGTFNQEAWDVMLEEDEAEMLGEVFELSMAQNILEAIIIDMMGQFKPMNVIGAIMKINTEHMDSFTAKNPDRGREMFMLSQKQVFLSKGVKISWKFVDKEEPCEED